MLIKYTGMKEVIQFPFCVILKTSACSVPGLIKLPVPCEYTQGVFTVSIPLLTSSLVL